jgi:hypothetical protein
MGARDHPGCGRGRRDSLCVVAQEAGTQLSRQLAPMHLSAAAVQALHRARLRSLAPCIVFSKGLGRPCRQCDPAARALPARTNRTPLDPPQTARPLALLLRRQQQRAGARRGAESAAGPRGECQGIGSGCRERQSQHARAQAPARAHPCRVI